MSPKTSFSGQFLKNSLSSTRFHAKCLLDVFRQFQNNRNQLVQSCGFSIMADLSNKYYTELNP